ncbi:MAG TPA: hypothetical protein VJB57_06350 [Dehalococcoidia bacterium]|nr:hypothetical protein [Dehalococcoidia bacterium]
MTNSTDVFSSHRIPLRAALQSTLDACEYSYAALLQSQMAITAHDEDVMLPGLVCLAIADAVGGEATVARGPAVSLVLLGAMRRVFDGIASEGASELEREWGMPRALNAGDGFYALAHSNLIAASGELGAEKRLLALGILDRASHELSLDMHAGIAPGVSLLSAGAALGGLFAGADLATVSQLGALGSDLQDGLPDQAREALEAAATYLRNRSRR